jgi:hypothetical protein
MAGARELTNVVGVAGGTWHSLTLLSDGRVLGWGAPVPDGLSNVVGVAAGEAHSLALLRQPTVPALQLDLSRTSPGLEWQARGTPGVSAILLRAAAVSGPWRPTQAVTFTNAVQHLRTVEPADPAQFFRLLRR